jgi:hypothetical protein
MKRQPFSIYCERFGLVVVPQQFPEFLHLASAAVREEAGAISLPLVAKNSTDAESFPEAQPRRRAVGCNLATRLARP